MDFSALNKIGQNKNFLPLEEKFAWPILYFSSQYVLRNIVFLNSENNTIYLNEDGELIISDKDVENQILAPGLMITINDKTLPSQNKNNNQFVRSTSISPSYYNSSQDLQSKLLRREKQIMSQVGLQILNAIATIERPEQKSQDNNDSESNIKELNDLYYHQEERHIKTLNGCTMSEAMINLLDAMIMEQNTDAAYVNDEPFSNSQQYNNQNHFLTVPPIMKIQNNLNNGKIKDEDSPMNYEQFDEGIDTDVLSLETGVLRPINEYANEQSPSTSNHSSPINLPHHRNNNKNNKDDIFSLTTTNLNSNITSTISDESQFSDHSGGEYSTGSLDGPIAKQGRRQPYSSIFENLSLDSKTYTPFNNINEHEKNKTYLACYESGKGLSCQQVLQACVRYGELAYPSWSSSEELQIKYHQLIRTMLLTKSESLTTKKKMMHEVEPNETHFVEELKTRLRSRNCGPILNLSKNFPSNHSLLMEELVSMRPNLKKTWSWNEVDFKDLLSKRRPKPQCETPHDSLMREIKEGIRLRPTNTKDTSVPKISIDRAFAYCEYDDSSLDMDGRNDSFNQTLFPLWLPNSNPSPHSSPLIKQNILQLKRLTRQPHGNQNNISNINGPHSCKILNSTLLKPFGKQNLPPRKRYSLFDRHRITPLIANRIDDNQINFTNVQSSKDDLYSADLNSHLSTDKSNIIANGLHRSSSLIYKNANNDYGTKIPSRLNNSTVSGNKRNSSILSTNGSIELNSSSFNAGKNNESSKIQSTINLSYREFCHIRKALYEANCESHFDGQSSNLTSLKLYKNLKLKQICFDCHKSLWSLFGTQGVNCSVCTKVLCNACYEKIIISNMHLTNIPKKALIPQIEMDEVEKKRHLFKNNVSPPPIIITHKASPPLSQTPGLTTTPNFRLSTSSTLNSSQESFTSRSVSRNSFGSPSTFSTNCIKNVSSHTPHENGHINDKSKLSNGNTEHSKKKINHLEPPSNPIIVCNECMVILRRSYLLTKLAKK